MQDNCVGIVEPVGGHGGMDYYDYGLALGLANNGMQVRYFTCDKTKERQYKNVTTVISFKKMWKRNFFLKTFKYLLGHHSAFRDLKKNKSKIVHLHFFTFRSIDLLILYLAKLNKLKAIVTVHDVNAFDKKADSGIERRCYRLIDGVIVHNESSLNTLNKKNKLTVPVTVIPHGNYLPFISPTRHDVRAKGVFTLLFFGQIKKVKGLDLLLKAVGLIKRDGYALKLIIAGKAWKSDLEEYEKLIAGEGLNTIVQTDFRYIPDEEVAEYYSKADLVVLPYREIYQSGVLLLTMSYGKPVLCSDLQPFREVIRHDKNGFLFESENIEDLSRQIIVIMKTPAKLESVTKASDILIRTKYDWNDIGMMTKEFYAQFLTVK